ncbi:iron-containing alcohol dehydrogenase, partial [Klebsiella pneumoniae]
HMPDVSRFFIVTDQTVANEFGNRITDILANRLGEKSYEIFQAVNPDPDSDVIFDGVHRMKIFKPDVIIALGGGSVMDAAKAMRLFYENPDMSFED